MYYEDMLEQNTESGPVCSPVETASLCPKGITVIGEGTVDIDKYAAGVVAHEAYQSEGMEALKAQAVVARTFGISYTNKCSKPIPNNTSAQTYSPNPGEKAIQSAQETAGQVLTYNGEVFLSQYDSYCYDDGDCPDSVKNADGTYSVTYTKKPNEEKHKITLSDPKQYSRITHNQGHANGMSQLVSYQLAKEGKTYDEILKYFYSPGVEIGGSNCSGGEVAPQFIGDQKVYGSNGIYAQSIFPIATDYSNIYVTQGYRYSTGGSHGAVDIFCNRDKAKSGNVSDLRAFCNSIPIVAAHAGTIISMNNEYCASKYTRKGDSISNLDTTLTRKDMCYGLGINVKITDQSDPYYGYIFVYYHFEKFADGIKVGAQIAQGQLLGYMGSTGISTGWHLHFGIKNKSETSVNQNNTIRAFCSSTGLRCNKLYGDGEGPQG